MRLRFPIFCALAAAFAVACGGGGTDTGGGTQTNTTPVVKAVNIVPSVGQVELGATTLLTLDVRDQFGAVMTGKTATWTSSVPAVATVDGTGLAKGLSTGSSTISAAIDGVTGLSILNVIPPQVASVAVAPPAAAVAIGAVPALSVTIKDKNGNVLTGRTITWSSSATRVATVNASTGAITGVSAGATTITALSEGVSGTAVVTVAAPAGTTAPVITSVTPATLTAGAPATISGTNLVAGVGTSTVFIAGVQATVVSATATQIVATVPAAGIPCQTTQAVNVEVTTVAGTNSAKQPMNGATSRPLLVGQSFVETAAGNVGCNELPSAGTYLISVFNAGSLAGQATGFELKGTVGGALAARIGQTSVKPDMIPASTGARAQLDPVLSAEATEHLRHMESDRALVRQLGSPRNYSRTSRSVIPGTTLPGPSRVPVPTTVGQTAQMYYHYNSCSTTGAGTVQLTARVVYVGPKVIVMEDNAGALAGKIDADMTAMAQEFETVSFPILTGNFGDPLAYDASTDNNGRIIMLFTPKVNAQSSNLLGFVSSCDLYSPTLALSVSASNQAEIFYARAVTDTTAAATSLDSRNTWRRLMPSTLIHETKHIVSNAERFQTPVNITAFEESWLEEATAQLASEMYARVAHGNGWRSNAAYFGTLDCEVRPNTANCGLGIQTMANHFGFLTQYLQSFESSTILSNGTDDNNIYGSAWMFTRWLTDTYGGSDEGAFIKKIVHNYNITGVDNVTNVTGKKWSDLLAQFTTMLASDDLANVPSPYTEQSWNLPGVFLGRNTDLSSKPSATPLVPRSANSGAFTTNVASLKGGGAMLLKLNAVAAGAPQLLDLHDAAGVKLGTTSAIGIAVLRIQ